MGEVSDLEARRSKTKPQKNANASTSVTKDDFLSNDEVMELTALKSRLAEMLAKRDIHERDFKAISVEYRAVRIELQEARDRAKAAGLGKRPGGLHAVGDRPFDGDI